MAKRPVKSSGSRLSNIMGILRGNIDLDQNDASDKTLSLGSAELISAREKQKLLQGVANATEDKRSGNVNRVPNIMSMVQTSLSKVGSERMENRKILSLMPEVDKAARLMIASTFAPNDLSTKNIQITFDTEVVPESTRQRLNDYATEFFQKKLNLKKSAPNWVYQFGYETGASVFAIVPLRSFETIQENSYLGIESFQKEVVDVIANESLLGFGYSTTSKTEIQSDTIGLESYTDIFIKEGMNKLDTAPKTTPAVVSKFIEQIIGQESLKLTDNPSILQTNEDAKKKVSKRNKDLINRKFRRPSVDTVLSVPTASENGKKSKVLGDPILIRLPPESVTVIHTPGDPNDHQGYLVLLDNFGNPINATTMDEAQLHKAMDYSKSQNNIFNQVYDAYGINSGFRGHTKNDSMILIYNQIVSEHLKRRVGKAGYTNVELGNTDSMMRCMFSRFLQQKQTRVLFLPKDLVTYMSFELDQNGYGISRLDRIKFNLGMKMAVQVSRVMAAINAAMNRRRVEVRFTENLLEQPESIFNSIMTEYMRKSTMSFSIDPNVIQNQIIDKSLSIKGINMPGMEEFDLTNEPDNRTGAVDFDPEMTNYLDKQILHGLRVPPATMNSVGEDEYARSVTTTNLFFAMDVSLDQDVVIHHVSDVIRKYGTYSESFIQGLIEIIPALSKKASISSTDDTKESEEAINLPEGFTIDDLIEVMSISLPRPNVAPSKAQFESLNAMIESISSTVEALFPDELIGSDDTLGPAIKLVKAKFKTLNIRNYLESSGLNGLDVPESNFTDIMPDINAIQDALANLTQLLKDKAKINVPETPEDPSLAEYK